MSRVRSRQRQKELKRHLLRKHIHKAKLLAIATVFLWSLSSSWKGQQTLHWSLWGCTPLSTTRSVSQQQLVCMASHSASVFLPPHRVHFPDPNTSEQQRAADQTWAQRDALCLQIRSAPLNQQKLLNLN